MNGIPRNIVLSSISAILPIYATTTGAVTSAFPSESDYAACASFQQQAETSDKEQLAIALDYFSSGKYREALNILSRLDKRYKLNARFKAYIGVCYFYEWDYKMTCKYLDPVMADIEVYAPHEKSIYFFANAESHFMLEEYKQAIPLYEKMLTVCFDTEKGDAYFRLGFCYMQESDWLNALDNLNSSLLYYEQFGYPENKQARVVQIKKMIAGCRKAIGNPQ